MATLGKQIFICCAFAALLSVTASSLFENLITNIDPCQEVCQRTYLLYNHKSFLEECCERGCRLYSIIEPVTDDDGINGTMKSCYDDCRDSYPGEEEASACILGCRSQKPFADRKEQVTGVDLSLPEMDMNRMLYPLVYMHNMYTNMLDEATNQMCMSWSFLVQDGGDKVIVIRSGPQALHMDVQDFDDYSSFRGTSSVFETNIEPAESTATEVLGHSQQLKSVRTLADAAEAESWKYKLSDVNNSDWLSCIARKTGLPRLLLCMTILISAVAMIWLCMSAAITAPDHRLTQKLSIQGDLEYLRYLPDKKGIQGVHLQDFVQARPLPVKIRVQQI